MSGAIGVCGKDIRVNGDVHVTNNEYILPAESPEENSTLLPAGSLTGKKEDWKV